MSAHDRPTQQPSVPRSVRVGSFLLSILLMLLFIWLLGFVLEDIGDIDGPDYGTIRDELVDVTLRERIIELDLQISELETQVARQGQLQEDLGRSMDNARQTMQQMMDLQRLSLEQQVPPTETEKEALAVAQQRFLGAQERFETANAEIASSNATRFELQRERASLERTLGEQEQPAEEEYQRRWQAHQFRVAALKLSFIVPVFLVSAWALARRRKSVYRPILLATLGASFWMLGRVMFDHFPREFFKYIAIVAAIAIVLWFLAWMLRKSARPGRDLLLARYREAYCGHVCPVCAHPIARGPLRYAIWTRKGPRLPTGSEAVSQDGTVEVPYGCPSCGTTLFAACDSCGNPRHTLLPYCEHCGDELSTGALAREA